MFHCASINVNGLRTKNKRDKILNWLLLQNFDVCFLQETHFSAKVDIETFGKEWFGSCFHSLGTNYSCGVSILFKKKIPSENLKVVHDSSGRFLSVIYDLNDTAVQFCNVYAPNNVSERAEFFESLSPLIKRGISTVLGGDFNCVEDIFLDKSGGDTVLGASAINSLQDLIQSHCLFDIFRHLHPSSKVFTWSNPGNQIFCRLDRFYVSRDVFEKTSVADIKPFSFSDHDLPFISFNLPTCLKRGPGYWKFNTSLLENEIFVDKMRTFLNHWCLRKLDFSNLHAWWDIGKRKIKHICMKFSKRLAKERREKRVYLENQIRIMQESRKIDNIDSLREAIKKLDNESIRGAQIRSKDRFFYENEKSNRYFFNLESTRQERKVINAIKNEHGHIIKDSKGILQRLASFYYNLFSSEPCTAKDQEILLSSISLKLSDSQKSSLEDFFTKEELHAALSSMKSCKSPGNDGLPMEFYVSFWDIIGNDFTDLVNFFLQDGYLSESMRLAIISLIFKSGDKLECKNWRPISLLNVDYKIIAKAMANRLKILLPFVTNPDQTCSVPDRSIFDNLYLVRDAFEYMKQKELSCGVLKLDQEKAFDRVNHEFLFKVLHKMNFGPVFISFIRVLYTEVYSCVLNNGHFSESFAVSRGVRQGCPLSPLLFVLVAESLGNVIRSNNNIKGLPIPGSCMKMSQYADDTTVFVSDAKSLHEIKKSTELYERGSGAKFNFNPGKSAGMWVGEYTGPSNLFGFDFTSTSLKILGIEFGNDSSVSDSWNARINKLEKKLDIWRSRCLSLRGKVLIINSLALSGLIFLASVLSIPKNSISRINKLIFGFLWSDKNELVRRESVFQPVDRGGLGLINIELKCRALHLKMINQITNKLSNLSWLSLSRYWIGRSLVKYNTDWSFLQSNSRANSLYRPPIYNNLLNFFDKYYSVYLSLNSKSRTVQIFYIKMLELDFVNPKCYREWINHGIGSWGNVWLSSMKGLSTGFVNDVSWKIIHRVIPTCVYLNSWGIPNVDIYCRRCPFQPETIEHLFLECSTSIQIWTRFHPFLSKLVNSSNIVNSKFIFLHCYPPSVNRKKKLLTNYIVKLICSEI